jgi:hypothetical protein
MSVPVFSYSITPSSLLVSQVQQLVLTVTNSTGAPVTCGLDFMLTLTLPVGNGATDLVTAAGAANVTAAPQDPNWSQNVDYDGSSVTIGIFPARSSTLPTNGQLVVLISTVAVNATVNTPGAALSLQPSDRSGNGPLVSLNVAKIGAGQTVSAYANPVGVGQGQSTTLFWSASGGSHIQLLLNGQVVQDEPFTGNGPLWSGSFLNVKPYPNTPQTTYQVTVFNTSGSSQLTTPVQIGLESPLISPPLKATKQTGLLINETVDLSWGTQYGAAVYLTPSSGGTPVQVALDSNGYSVKPGDWLAGDPNRTNASATLSVTGYLGPAKSTLAFSFAPAAIIYFSYASMDPTGGVSTPVVFNGSASLVSGAGNAWTVNVAGPGGPLTRSIGTGGPCVNYFGPANSALGAPGNVTLSYWVTGMQTGDTLSLNGAAVSVDASGKGSTVVSPTASTSYTLLAVLSGQSISNTVNVTISG